MRHLFYSYSQKWREASRAAEAGFTMVELIVVVVVLGILTPVVIGTLGDIYSWNTTSLGQNSQNTYTRGALRSIESDVAFSSGWTSSLALSVPWAGPTNSSSNETWSYCGIGSTTTNCVDSTSINRVLILYTTATDKVPTDSSRLPIFAKTSGTCDYTKTIKVAKIYFVAQDSNNSSKNDLYRRTIVNPNNQIPCDGTTPYQVTSCALPVASNCGSHVDTVLARNIKTFDVKYYVKANDPTTSSLSYTTASANDISSSDAIVVTATTEMSINGNLSQQTASIRVSIPVGTM